MTEDFVSEKIEPRRKRLLIQLPLSEFRDPTINHITIVMNRFKEVFGKNAAEFGSINVEILQEDVKMDCVEILVTGYIRYFVPRLVDQEDYLG